MNISDLGVKFVAKKTNQGIRYQIVPSDGSLSYGVKLTAASSGTQNLVPLNVIVEYYSKYYNLVDSINKAILSFLSKSDSLSIFKAVQDIGSFSKKNVHLIIEEPELSLYPSSQCDLVDFLLKSIAQGEKRGYNISLMMATHSPYIINYLNVLLRRYNCHNNVHGGSVASDDLSVYRVFEGRIQNLVGLDENGHMAVDTSDLSEVMESIYNEYVSLR